MSFWKGFLYLPTFICVVAMLMLLLFWPTILMALGRKPPWLAFGANLLWFMFIMGKYTQAKGDK